MDKREMIDFSISAIEVVSEPTGIPTKFAIILMHAWQGVLDDDASEEEILAAGPPLAAADTAFCLN